MSETALGPQKKQNKVHLTPLKSPTLRAVCLGMSPLQTIFDFLVFLHSIYNFDRNMTNYL